MTLAEQLRDALADYRRADDRGDEVSRGAAFARMVAVHEAIRRARRQEARP